MSSSNASLSSIVDNTYTIENKNTNSTQTILSCVLGFHNSRGKFEKPLVYCSVLSIIPLIGGVVSLLASVGRGAFDFRKDSKRGTSSKVLCGFLVAVRIILSCLGAGVIFFLLDILYTFGCWLISKVCGNKE